MSIEKKGREHQTLVSSVKEMSEMKLHSTPNFTDRITGHVVHGAMGCGQKKRSVILAVPPAPVRVHNQMSLAPIVASVTSVANDKGDNEMILKAVHRSPGICLTAEENPRKPELGDRLMIGLCDQSSPQMHRTARQEWRRIIGVPLCTRLL